MSDALPTGRRLTSTEWLICVIASIGFAFDIYELLMLPLIVRPALMELLNIQELIPGNSDFALFQTWVGRLFYVPAFAGGIFGLLGGYLTDRLGRRRVLTWSILLYAFSAFAAGFSTNPWMLLFFRSTTFIGVCVEFVAAVAWLAELFTDPKQREKVLGYTQAFSSVGGLLVTGANHLALQYAAMLPAIAVPAFLTGIIGSIAPEHQHEAWRYTLMSGLIPAIPLIIIRPFLPESPVWEQKRKSGTLKRPSLTEIFAPQFARTTIVTTIMFACSYGAAFGAIQQIPQIVPGLPEVRAMKEGKTPPEQRKIEQEQAKNVQFVQEFGGLAGRFAFAAITVWIVSRQALIRSFQIPGLIILPVVFAYVAVTNISLLYVGMFLVGFMTVAQFSFWGNYLPRVYPVHLRGTGESFAANIGGRLIGTSFAFVTTTLATSTIIPGDTAPTKMAYSAAIVGTTVYLVGLIASFWLPEPKQEMMD